MAKKTEAPPAKKRIYIVDDHPVFRAGLAGIIQQQPDLAVCGEADNAAKAFTEIARLKPDLLLADIGLAGQSGLAGKSGLELLKDLHACQPGFPVLVISMHDESLYAERVLRAGGRGYIMKQEGPEKILQAIARVLAGKVYVSERMSAAILEQIGRPDSKAKASPIGRLTDREFEILRMLGEGSDGGEIARSLHLSLKTVNTHRTNIRTKLGLKNAAAVIHFASRWLAEEQ
jgi:DNA-binding NarL/FixJ family response regulator